MYPILYSGQSSPLPPRQLHQHTDQAGGDVCGVQVHMQVVDVGEELTASTSAYRMLPKAAEVRFLE